MRDGAGLFDALSRRKPSLILLDIMLPGEDGLRVPGSGFETVPIIFLSALGELADRVVARIRALLLRSSMSGTSETLHTTMHVPEEVAEIWKLGPWRINMAAHHLIDENDVAVALSDNEFKLLKYFLMNPRRESEKKRRWLSAPERCACAAALRT